jgi:hypothetical protein
LNISNQLKNWTVNSLNQAFDSSTNALLALWIALGRPFDWPEEVFLPFLHHFDALEAIGDS